MKTAYENWNPDDLYKLEANKNLWGSTDDPTVKAQANAENKALRARYGMSDADDVSVNQLGRYIALAEQNQQKNQLLTNLTTSALEPSKGVRESADAIRNFSYNPETDAAYQSYVDMYNRQGQSAAKQTINNLNSANMGRNSSYSAAATAQVQQAYAQKASEMIPVLAEQAYNKLLQNYNIERDLDDTKYNRMAVGYNTLADAYTRQLTDEYTRHQLEQDQKWAGKEREQAYNINSENLAQSKIATQVAQIELDALPTLMQQQIQNGEYTLEEARIRLAHLPAQLQNDVLSGKLSLKNAEYQNRIAAVEADIAETYGMSNAEYENTMYKNQANGVSSYSGRSGGSSGGGSSGGGVDTKNIDRFVKTFNTNMKNGGGYYDTAGVEGDILLGSNGKYQFGSNIGGNNAWYGPLVEAIFSDPYLTSDEQVYLLDYLGLNDSRTTWIDSNGDKKKTKDEYVWISPYDQHLYATNY